MHMAAVNDPMSLSPAQYASYTTHEDEAVRIMCIAVIDLDAADDAQQLITAQLN